MFVAVNELEIEPEHQEKFETEFAASMRATLPGVAGLTRATLLRPSETGRRYLASLEFQDEAAYHSYLRSESFHAAHPWPGQPPIAGSNLTTYEVHTEMVELAT